MRKRLLYAVTPDEALPPDYNYINDPLNERDETPETPDDDVEGEEDEYVPNESFD